MTEKSNIRVEQLNMLIRTHDFQQLLDLARPIFGNPLILSNPSHTVMAITEEPMVNDPNWLEITSSKGIPMGVVTNSEINENYRTSLEINRPVIDSATVGNFPMLRKALSVRGRVLGYLDAPLYFRTADENDVEFFDFLSNLITVELQKDLDRAALPDNMLDYFVYDLLEGKVTDRRLIEERLEYFQWNLCAKGKVQIISIQGRTRELIPDNTRFRHLLDLFSSTFQNFRSFAYVSGVKMLCPVSESVRGDEWFLEQLQEILAQEDLVAGISRPLIGLESIPDFNRQAVKAAELGRRLHPERYIHFYDSYAIYHALELASEQENLLQFCHSAVILLRDYDLTHETDLLESLRVYLTHNRSIGESAAALYIHRNTMNYRIARINELTRMDLSDPDIFCHLLFSFYALDYRKALELEEPGGRLFAGPENLYQRDGNIGPQKEKML